MVAEESANPGPLTRRPRGGRKGPGAAEPLAWRPTLSYEGAMSSRRIPPLRWWLPIVVAIGAPSDEMRDRFTRVLKGHIALATARFPEGTNGAQLDSFARRPLWEAGLDYGHGTGHGVGAYLSVHEGPQNISPRGTAQTSVRPPA